MSPGCPQCGAPATGTSHAQVQLHDTASNDEDAITVAPDLESVREEELPEYKPGHTTFGAVLIPKDVSLDTVGRERRHSTVVLGK